jgi:hypothetical protein
MDMAKMSENAIYFALSDARDDILTMARLLCEAGYPRRGTDEEGRDIYAFAERVQKLIPHEEAVNLPANAKVSDGVGKLEHRD